MSWAIRAKQGRNTKSRVQNTFNRVNDWLPRRKRYYFILRQSSTENKVSTFKREPKKKKAWILGQDNKLFCAAACGDWKPVQETVITTSQRGSTFIQQTQKTLKNSGLLRFTLCCQQKKSAVERILLILDICLSIPSNPEEEENETASICTEKTKPSNLDFLKQQND